MVQINLKEQGPLSAVTGFCLFVMWMGLDFLKKSFKD